ncbi:hypothetical protein ACOI1H_17640 [Loktanella sp. DJP18]|uniref:hypothetical protein n=1 Tax=Loktanella sp. DJP18 TaxID=3409788 RepID=UPI003BB704A7
MITQNEPISDEQAHDIIKQALARVSLDFGVIRTKEILGAALGEFTLERQVVGAHGYGYRK